MRRIYTIVLVVLAICLPMTTLAKSDHLLPRPQKISIDEKAKPFKLGRKVCITDSKGVKALRCFFEGQDCKVDNKAKATVTVTYTDAIKGAFDHKLAGYDNEAYTLEISTDAIEITAVSETGVIRAAQTLAQLAQGYKGKPKLEALTITDWPAFKVRGYMHDVGRSFISIETLKKHVDLLARFKVNTFHWHMTENQAWRFEIKAYPQLTSSESMTRYPMANRWGNNGNSDRLYFLRLQNHCRW